MFNRISDKHMLIPVTAETVTAEAVTIPAGAAGVVVEVQLAKRPVLSANGGALGGSGDTSLSFGTGTTFTAEVDPNVKDADLTNGQYWVDYASGLIHGKKADGGVADTATYQALVLNTDVSVDLSSLVAAVETEDTAHTTGDKGIMDLGVANEAQSTLAADGDYIAKATDTKGNQIVVGTKAHDAVVAGAPVVTASEAKDFDGSALPNVVSAEGDVVRNASSLYGIQYVMVVNEDGSKTPAKNEDDAHASGDMGYQILVVRKDSPTALAGTDGDYIPLIVDANGALHANLATALSAAIDSISTKPVAPSNINTSAYATNLVIKAATGKLYAVRGYNSSGSTQFIQLHDAASLPADAAVPEDFIAVPTATSFEITFPQGKSFATGIVVCNSSTGPTKTIGAADCWFSAEYE